MFKGPLIYLFALALLMGGVKTSVSHADTLTYNAITDFPIIDAGVVPYYRDSPIRNALAVNAAVAEYRDKFARAEVVYDAQAGRFDMTIIGLAELDGAAVYNLLVNGEIVGTATNPPVATDYTPIRHTFEDIDVPSGAILAVESLANSNDTIPEGDGFAFARGRWTALELTSADAAPTPSNFIDLSLSMTSNKQALIEGQQIIVTLNAGNSANSIVATAPLLRLDLPRTGLAFVSGTNCSLTSQLIECALPELAAGQETSVNITLMATSVNPSVDLSARIRANQIDSFEVNNTASLNFVITEAPEATTTDASTDADVNTPAESDQNIESTSPTESGSLSLFWLLLLPICFRRTAIVDYPEIGKRMPDKAQALSPLRQLGA